MAMCMDACNSFFLFSSKNLYPRDPSRYAVRERLAGGHTGIMNSRSDGKIGENDVGKMFGAAFLGSLVGAGVVVAAMVMTMQANLSPMIILTSAAAEKTLGPQEAERIVRDTLGREWHAYVPGSPPR